MGRRRVERAVAVTTEVVRSTRAIALQKEREEEERQRTRRGDSGEVQRNTHTHTWCAVPDDDSISFFPLLLLVIPSHAYPHPQRALCGL